MEDNNRAEEPSGIDEKRRTLLKSGLAGAFFTIGGSSLLSEKAAGYQSVEENFAQKDSDQNSLFKPDSPNCYNAGQVGTQIGGSVAYRFSEKTEKGDWMHYFGAGIDGKHLGRDGCDGTLQPNEGIQQMKHTIEDTSSSTGVTLYTPAGGPDVGANPNPNYNEDVNYVNAAFTILKIAISEVSPGANATSMAAEVLDSAFSAPQGTYDNTDTFSWDYSGNQPTEAHSHVLWHLKNPDKDTGSCKVTQVVHGDDQYMTWAGVEANLTVNDGSNDDGNIDISPQNDVTTTDEETVFDDNHVVVNKDTKVVKNDKKVGPVQINAEDISTRTGQSRQKGQEVTLVKFPSKMEITTYGGYLKEPLE